MQGEPRADGGDARAGGSSGQCSEGQSSCVGSASRIGLRVSFVSRVRRRESARAGTQESIVAVRCRSLLKARPGRAVRTVRPQHQSLERSERDTSCSRTLISTPLLRLSTGTRFLHTPTRPHARRTAHAMLVLPSASSASSSLASVLLARSTIDAMIGFLLASSPPLPQLVAPTQFTQDIAAKVGGSPS